MLFEKYGILGKQNKLNSYQYYFKMLLSKLDDLFVWYGLPPEIDKSFLNMNLFLLGYSAWYQIDGKVYTNFGGIGGKPNENYYPTQFILSNPVQGSKQFTINSGLYDDAVIMYNTEADKQFISGMGTGGLYTLIKQTATLLADNIQSISMAQINTRVQTVMTASTDQQARAAEQIIKRMYNGDPYQILVQDEINPITVSNVDPSTADNIDTLLQVHQYILADFYNQIGIPTTPYQKKERMITDEIDTLDKTNACNLDTMLSARREACYYINKMLDLDIDVDLASWLKEKEEKDDDTEAKSEDKSDTTEPEETDETTDETEKASDSEEA